MPEAPDPKSGVSANSTTLAWLFLAYYGRKGVSIIQMSNVVVRNLVLFHNKLYNARMRKNRAYRRSQRLRVIRRKICLLRKYGGDNYVLAWSGGGKTGRFAKGKIHCSCYMCRRKSYDFLSHADRKKLIAARQQLNEI